MSLPTYKHPTLFVQGDGEPELWEYHFKLDAQTALLFRGHFQSVVIDDTIVYNCMFYISEDGMSLLYWDERGKVLRTDTDTPVYIQLIDYDYRIQDIERDKRDLQKLLTKIVIPT